MNEGFVLSAKDIRGSIAEFNARAPANHEIALSLLRSTSYWVYDPDDDTFGPGKFVGFAGMTFGSYRTRRYEVSGADTRAAIERSLDDFFDQRPSWRRRLRDWGTALIGPKAFGAATEMKWRFTSLRPKVGRKAELLVEDEDSLDFPEGELSYVRHRKRERSTALVKAKKKQALKAHGRLACDVCSFDFRARYGDVGGGFIECHHIIPVSELKRNAKTRLEDVALVCSNCHRMIHRRRPWLRIHELSKLLVVS